MKSIALFLSGLIIGSGFIACTKSATSNQPNYIYKSAPTEGAVAKIAGEIISYEDAFKGLENDIYEAELKVYEIMKNRLRAMVVEKFMEQDPRKEGLTNDEFLKRYVAKSLQITDTQINEFIKEREIPAEHVNDQMKLRIREYLEAEGRHKAVEKWIAEKTAKEPVEIYISKPSRPVFNVVVGDAPVTGGGNAKVTIVEFSDFQCPFCARGSNVMNQLKAKYGNRIKIAYKNFPLPFHNHARDAAVAGLCAHEQKAESFWRMKDLMFEDQQSLTQDHLIAHARSLGLDHDKFVDCLSRTTMSARIDRDIAEGQELGVKSTPTFFVNGMMVTGAQSIEVFSELIDQELAK
jgi:protein-disulfide isomerase